MNKLKTFREKHKIEQKDLAKLLGTTQQQISLYETNRRELKETQIEKIINEYDAKIEDLIEVKRMRIEDTMLEIGEYIKNKEGIVTYKEILDKYTNKNYAKLRDEDTGLIELMIEEHNKRFE